MKRLPDQRPEETGGRRGPRLLKGPSERQARRDGAAAPGRSERITRAEWAARNEQARQKEQARRAEQARRTEQTWRAERAEQAKRAERIGRNEKAARAAKQDQPVSRPRLRYRNSTASAGAQSPAPRAPAHSPNGRRPDPAAERTQQTQKPAGFEAAQNLGRDPQDAELTLRDVIGLVIVHRNLVALVAALFVAAALAYVVTRERPYVASTRILLDPLGIQVLDGDVLRRTESSDGGAAMVESHMRVLTSESVLKQVVASENLTEDKEFIGGNSNIISSAIGAVKGLFAEKRPPSDPTIKAFFNLQKAVDTSRPQRSYIIDLYVKTKDADKSARLANVIAQTYIESEVEARSGLAQRASGTLTARLNELRTELAEAESAVELYKSRNNILETNGSKVNEQELEQLNRLLVEAEARTSLARSNLEQIEAAQLSAGDLNNIPEALSSSTISGLRIRLAAALQQRSVLSAELLPSHPSMTAADAQVTVVTQQIKQELSRIIGRARADVERALAEQRQIERRLDTIKQSTFVTNDARVRLRELTRDADTKRAIYESFLLRARELGEQQGVDTNQARIISNAVPPLRPSGPSSILILVAALVIGVAAGIMVALVRGYFSILMADSKPFVVPQAADRVKWPTQSGATASLLPWPRNRARPTRKRVEVPG